jgi:hypothetical protein
LCKRHFWILDSFVLRDPRTFDQSATFPSHERFLIMAEKLDLSSSIWPLKGRVQNYAWGNVGSGSTVAKLFHADAKSPIDESKPYAGSKT